MRRLALIIGLLGILACRGFAQANDKPETGQLCVLKVSGMKCGECEGRVESVAKQIGGVKDASASQPKGTAAVRYDPAKTSPEEIARIISEKTGFSAEISNDADLVAASWVASAAQTHESKHLMVTSSAITWEPAPPSLPPGAQTAVLEGDPTKAGPFTMRVKMPDGYKIQPHWHPADEHLTVLEGTFVMGLGDKFDEAAGKELSTGSFSMMPVGTRHFAWTKGDTTIQLHGIGPWGITYVNAADDPRKKSSQND